MPPDQWAKENRIYPETAGIPGPRDPDLTSYMVPFARAVHEGNYRRFVAVTSAQAGKSDTILDVIGARLDQKPAPLLYVGPNKQFLEDQFEPRLMELLDQSEALSAKVERGKRMKKLLKRISGVRLRLAHAGSSTALKSDPAAMAFIDEYDEMSRGVNKQGDVLGLVEARGTTYADFVTVVTSTPSMGTLETEIDPDSGLEFWKLAEPKEIKSPIWRLWQEGTRYHFAWPCFHCNAYFIPRMKCLRWPDKATPARARRETTMICPNCGGIHTDEEHKTWMRDRGVMVAPGQVIDEKGNVTGDPPDTNTWSSWASGLTSPFVSWGERVEKYLTAFASGDPDRIQTAVNAGMGELFSPASQGDRPEWKDVMDRRVGYNRGTVPDEVIRLVMAVDVQKFSLIYVVRGFGARGSSWLIEEGQLYGPTDDDDVWNALADRMITPFDDGMHIEKVLIDSGFRPNKPDAGDEHKVYEFCRRWSFLAQPTKGVDTSTNPFVISKIEVNPKGKKATYSLNLVRVNTDFFKSLVYSRIHTPLGQPGSFFVHADITEDYAKQVVSEARVVDEDGRPSWVRLNRNNHFLDCEALCAVAGYALNVQRIPEGAVRNPIAKPEHERSGGNDDHLPPPPPKAPEPSIRNRFARLSGGFNR